MKRNLFRWRVPKVVKLEGLIEVVNDPLSPVVPPSLLLEWPTASSFCSSLTSSCSLLIFSYPGVENAEGKGYEH